MYHPSLGLSLKILVLSVLLMNPLLGLVPILGTSKHLPDFPPVQWSAWLIMEG